MTLKHSKLLDPEHYHLEEYYIGLLNLTVAHPYVDNLILTYYARNGAIRLDNLIPRRKVKGLTTNFNVVKDNG